MERLERRAKTGDSRALVELGKIYQKQSSQIVNKLCGGLEDDEKAHECFEKAASLGNGDAYHELSKLHKELYEAKDYLGCLQKAADLGNLDAHSELAELATRMNNYKVLWLTIKS